MQYTKLKNINKYKSENINPAKTPDTVFEMYSVPIYGNIKKLEKYVLLNVVLHHDQLISILRIMKVELIG